MSGRGFVVIGERRDGARFVASVAIYGNPDHASDLATTMARSFPMNAYTVAPLGRSEEDPVRRAIVHDKLVEANEVALTALEQMWKDYMSDHHPNLEQINDAMKGLRAALAKAKGEG